MSYTVPSEKITFISDFESAFSFVLYKCLKEKQANTYSFFTLWFSENFTKYTNEKVREFLDKSNIFEFIHTGYKDTSNLIYPATQFNVAGRNCIQYIDNLEIIHSVDMLIDNFEDSYLWEKEKGIVINKTANKFFKEFLKSTFYDVCELDKTITLDIRK